LLVRQLIQKEPKKKTKQNNNIPQNEFETVQLILQEDKIEFWELISQVKEGLEIYPPEICEDCVNGTYFLRDKNGNMIGIFKPQDEEGNSNNNPKKLIDPTNIIDKGILDGEGAQREVAAYLLDKNNGFVGVPKTTMVKLFHSSFGKNANGEPLAKVGSLQKFVQNDGSSWDIGFKAFPIHEVQKIAAFDLRIFNNDRHGGNMLMKKNKDGTYTLIPIDHGFSLPSSMNRAWFDWLTWPQAKQPITKEIKSYISNIDISNDLKILQKLNIRPECLRILQISTTLLKKGCQFGLTLYDIGSLVSRNVLEEPSEIELMYEKAQKKTGILNGIIMSIEDEKKKLLKALEDIIDEELAKKKSLSIDAM